MYKLQKKIYRNTDTGFQDYQTTRCFQNIVFFSFLFLFNIWDVCFRIHPIFLVLPLFLATFIVLLIMNAVFYILCAHHPNKDNLVFLTFQYVPRPANAPLSNRAPAATAAAKETTAPTGGGSMKNRNKARQTMNGTTATSIPQQQHYTPAAPKDDNNGTENIPPSANTRSGGMMTHRASFSATSHSAYAAASSSSVITATTETLDMKGGAGISKYSTKIGLEDCSGSVPCQWGWGLRCWEPLSRCGIIRWWVSCGLVGERLIWLNWPDLCTTFPNSMWFRSNCFTSVLWGFTILLPLYSVIINQGVIIQYFH